ncbi:MAG: 50S ribosomal protein L6 [Bacteroidales bacterium]|nr:50S ribosomal protein L6 [Bacteroidales bacterium]MBS3773855.1 50S ribosomal protein L6 [Bacteroidales bacterium]
MSRIGVLPINIPEGVNVSVDDKNEVHVKGPKGEISRIFDPSISIQVKDDQVSLSRASDSKKHKALHGLSRSLIQGMVEGVSQGYSVQLEFDGVGYRAEAKGQVLEMSVGFSHDIHFEIPEEIQLEATTQRRSNPKVTLSSHDKELLGQVASKIRAIRPPEPYKGRGIKYVGERIRRKAGKAGNV